MTAIVTMGDARALNLPDESIDLIVTSPPYWSLRSYTDGGEHYDGQIGAEPDPREYLDALIACTAEWSRVLKPAGSIFVNLGDKYASYEGNRGGSNDRIRSRTPRPLIAAGAGLTGAGFARNKSLLLLPQRYAIRCMDDLDLVCRQEIVWSKPNGMPESVTDRARRSHEQVWHLTKQPRYFSAVDEIREPHARGWKIGRNGSKARAGVRRDLADLQYSSPHPVGALPGDVWTIATVPLDVPEELEVDHHAAMPPELARQIILGWSPSGICVACGEGRRPVVDRTTPLGEVPLSVRDEERSGGKVYGATSQMRLSGGPRQRWKQDNPDRLVGYACSCWTSGDDVEPPPVRPAVVLDPFGGTGTTALVADVLGRTGISVDLSADYCRLARWRTQDPGERARALGVARPAPVADGQGDLLEGLLP